MSGGPGGAATNRNAPLTGGGLQNMAVGLRPMGRTPQMPSQQNFQQNQAAMPSAQPTQGMGGGGIFQPNPRNPQMGMQQQQQQGPMMLVAGQGPYTHQQLMQNAALSGGITWNGREPNFVGGRNNWLAPPSSWRGSDPGDVTQAQLDQIQNRVGGLRDLMQKDRRMINQGQRRQEGMDLLQQRMHNLRAYQRFMQGHLAATPPATDPAADPAANPSIGYASDSMGGLTNSAQLMAMLAAQQAAAGSGV